MQSLLIVISINEHVYYLQVYIIINKSRIFNNSFLSQKRVSVLLAPNKNTQNNRLEKCTHPDSRIGGEEGSYLQVGP